MTANSDTPSGGSGTSLEPLAYEGHVIHQRNEMVSLTDMWRAAGAPPTKRPSTWLSYDATREFVEHIGATFKGQLNALCEVKRGRGGGTWVHWQIALAYMKHLSPAFHAWGNTAIRERMEVARTPVIEAQPERRPGLSPQSAHDVGGIVKRGLQKNVPEILDAKMPGLLHEHVVEGIETLLRQAAEEGARAAFSNLLERVVEAVGEKQPGSHTEVTTTDVIALAGVIDRKGTKGLSRWIAPPSEGLLRGSRQAAQEGRPRCKPDAL